MSTMTKMRQEQFMDSGEDSKTSTSFEMISIDDRQQYLPMNENEQKNHQGNRNDRDNGEEKSKKVFRSFSFSKRAVLNTATTTTTTNTTTTSTSSPSSSPPTTTPTTTTRSSNPQNRFSTYSSSSSSPTIPSLPPPPHTNSKLRNCWNSIQPSPRLRMIILVAYLCCSAATSLYMTIVRTGLQIETLCSSNLPCFLYASQGWPVLGNEATDLLVMSYLTGIISIAQGILGLFGCFAIYKQSAKRVRQFAQVWKIMIRFIIGMMVTLFLIFVLHRQEFLNQCLDRQLIENNTEMMKMVGYGGYGSTSTVDALADQTCQLMHQSVLLGSFLGLVISMTMMWCYGGDVMAYSNLLDHAHIKSSTFDHV